MHDPNSTSMKRGLLSLIYPKALHVVGAVSMATMAGRLRVPRSSNLPADARLRLIAASLESFGTRLARSGRPAPAFSLLLIEPMLWSVIDASANGKVVTSHVAGPAAGALVAITDTPVVAALLDGKLSVDEAVNADLVKFYGPTQAIGELQATLRDAFTATPGGTIK